MEEEEEGATSLLPSREVRLPRKRLGVVVGGVGVVLLFVSAGILAFAMGGLQPWALLVPLAVALVLILVGYYLVR